MSTTKRPVSLNIILVVLILGLMAFILYFYFFINPAQVESILSKTNLSYYAGAFIAYSFFALFSALVWHELLKSLRVEIPVRKALLFSWAGLFFDAVVPQLGWSGEISKTYLLAKDSNIDAGKVGASVVGQKIFTITLTIVALSLGLGLILVSYPLPSIVTFLIALILSLSILTLLVILYVSIKPTATKTLLNWGLKIVKLFRRKWNPENFKQNAEGFLGKFHLGMTQLREKPKALIKPIIFAVTSFVFEISVISISFLALGHSVPIDKVLIVFTLTGTLQTVGVTMFGFTEIVMSSSFAFLGIPIDLSFSVTLLTRVVTLWFRLIVSYTALQWAGIKIIRNQQNSNLS